MKISLRLLCTLVLLTLFSPRTWAQQEVTWAPQELHNGSPCLFIVHAKQVTSVTGTWQKQDLGFFQVRSDPMAWYALAGIDVGVAPGNYELAIDIHHNDGTVESLHRTVQVTPAAYKEIPLTVPEKFVQPDAAALKIIAADQIIKTRAFSHSALTPLWATPFTPPLQRAPQTDSFGTRRVFNGSLASVHRGLDYHAKLGTPVMAANAGRVVLARPLYYEGNCIIIDHGLGVSTLYMHLSKFKVKEGDVIKRGQLIAWSGGTGRATGPHLHLSVRWDGQYLDPALLFLLKLPAPLQQR
jgi:murein DD-endopeptidase MepM/ murein hydrolase activator NlpD